MNGQVDDTRALLERAVTKFGSANAVADFLGFGKARMSMIRHGKQNLTPTQCARLADAMGEPWLHYVAPLFAERAASEADRDFWLGKALELARSGVLALVTLAASFGLESTVNHAQADDSHGNLEPEYTMCTIYILW